MSIYKDYLGIEFKSKKKIPTHMFFKQKLPNHAKKNIFKIVTNKTTIEKKKAYLCSRELLQNFLPCLECQNPFIVFFHSFFLLSSFIFPFNLLFFIVYVNSNRRGRGSKQNVCPVFFTTDSLLKDDIF